MGVLTAGRLLIGGKTVSANLDLPRTAVDLGKASLITSLVHSKETSMHDLDLKVWCPSPDL